MPNRLRLINSPTDSFVDYFLDSKPYHTKLLEIVETYTFEESMVVTFDERVQKDIIIENDPLCKQTGFGLDFDDECGYDAIDCCDLFDCFGGYGYIFDNSDELVDLPVVAYSSEQTDPNLGSWIEVAGNHLSDIRLPIKRIVSPNTLIFSGNVQSLFEIHSTFLIVNVQIFEITGNSDDKIFIDANHVDFFSTKNAFFITNENITNKLFYYHSVTYDPALNKTVLHLSRRVLNWLDTEQDKPFIQTYQIGDVVQYSGINYECVAYHVVNENDPTPDQDTNRWMAENFGGFKLQLKNSNSNTGIFQSFNTNYDSSANETHVVLADAASSGQSYNLQLKNEGDYTLGSVQLRTALKNPRLITINKFDEPDDHVNESRIAFSTFNPLSNRTRIYVNETLNFLDSVDISDYRLRTHGYFFEHGFGEYKQCGIPKSENIHSQLSERLHIEITDFPLPPAPLLIPEENAVNSAPINDRVV